MKKFLFTLFFGLFIFANSYSQVIVMDIVQVKDGMNAQYEAVEKFAEPIKREAVKMGKQLGWYIMKRKSGGDLSELENKGIGDYIILNIFKDEAQMKSGMDWNAIAKKVYKGKMSSRSIEKKLETLGAPRKDTRSYTLENIYYTKPGQANRGETVYIFPAEALNDEYEKYEMEVFRPMWEKRILEGSHKYWGFNKITKRSDNAYQNLTHIIFNMPTDLKSNLKTDFTTQKAMDTGYKSRKGFDNAVCEIIFLADAYNN